MLQFQWSMGPLKQGFNEELLRPMIWEIFFIENPSITLFPHTSKQAKGSHKSNSFSLLIQPLKFLLEKEISDQSWKHSFQAKDCLKKHPYRSCHIFFWQANKFIKKLYEMTLNKGVCWSIYNAYKGAKRPPYIRRNTKTNSHLHRAQPINKGQQVKRAISYIHPDPLQKIIQKWLYDCLI